MKSPERKSPTPSSRSSFRSPNRDRYEMALPKISTISIHDDIRDFFNDRFSQMYIGYPGTDRDYYDIRAERNSIHATNLQQTLSYLIKGSLGIGVLGMDEAFKHGGLWTSLGLSLIVAFVVYYTAWMLINSAQTMYQRLKTPWLTYPDLAEQAARCVTSEKRSKYFRYTVEVVLFIAQSITCSFCQIIIACTIKQVWEPYSKPGDDTGHKLDLYILAVTVPLLCLCLIRKLKYLALFSFLADFCIVTCIGVTVYLSILTISKGVPTRPAWRSWYGMFRFCGCCIYAIDGITTYLPIENHMRDPVWFVPLLQISSTVVLIAVVLVGALGYMAWGEACVTPVTFHMPNEVQPFIAFRIILAIMLNVTFAIHFWVQFRIPWHYIGAMYRDSPHRKCIERFYRTVNLFLVTFVSVICPDLYRSMSTLGACLLFATGCTFPATIETMVTWKEHRGGVRWVLVKNIILVIAGFLFACAVVYSNYIKLSTDVI